MSLSAPPRGQRGPVLLASLVTLALLASACASTAQVGGEPREVTFGAPETFDEGGVAGDEDEMSLPADAAPLEVTEDGSATSAPGAAPGSSAGGTGSTAGSGGTASPGGPGGGTAQPSPQQPATGGGSAPSDGSRPADPGAPGIDDRRITIGLVYVSDGGEGNEALGAGGLSTGDMRRQYDALIAHFNARGGAAGREIVPVYHGIAAATARSLEDQEQEACVKFTQDHEVFAVSTSGPTEAFAQCMTQAGVVDLSTSFFTMNDDAFLEAHPLYVEAASPGLNRLARMYVQGLDAAGYFEPESPTGETRIGLITYENPRYQRVVESDLKPALRAAGHELTDVRYVTQMRTLGQAGAMSAQINNAVLRFNSQRIDHVLFLDFNAGISLFFMQGAESQGYRPQYGLNSQSGGQVLVDLVPPAQLRNAQLVGWTDVYDVGWETALREGPQTRRACEQIFTDAGIAFEDENAWAIAMSQCDTIRLIVASVDASTGPVSPAGTMQGALSLGTSWESAMIGTPQLGPERRPGLNRYRAGAFFDECTCFRYTSDWRRAR